MGIPRCDKCDQCFHDKSKKYDGWTYYCKLNGHDVGQSHFGRSSPKACPNRHPTVCIDIEKTEAEEFAEKEYLRRVRAERKEADHDRTRTLVG